MDTENFIEAYGKFRNGTNGFFRHTMWRRMVYSDGVKECLETGMYWLFDIIGTECVKPVLASGLPLGILYVEVKEGKARLRVEMQEYAPPVWQKHVAYTDMPDGVWTFYLGNDRDGDIRVILSSEY